MSFHVHVGKAIRVKPPTENVVEEFGHCVHCDKKFISTPFCGYCGRPIPREITIQVPASMKMWLYENFPDSEKFSVVYACGDAFFIINEDSRDIDIDCGDEGYFKIPSVVFGEEWKELEDKLEKSGMKPARLFGSTAYDSN